MRRKVVGVSLALCLAVASGAWAEIGYGPIVQDDATVQTARAYEFRLDAMFEDLGDELGGGSVDTRWDVEASLDYGITDRLEVGTSVPWVALENGSSESGMDDVTVSGKYLVATESETTPGVSAGIDAVLDTGDDKIVGEDNDVDYKLNIVLSKGFARWNAHVNLGFLNPGETGVDEVWSYGFTAEIPLGTGDLVVEAAASDEDIGGDEPVDVYLGFREPMSEAADLAGVVGFGLSDASPDLTAAIVYRSAF